MKRINKIVFLKGSTTPNDQRAQLREYLIQSVSPMQVSDLSSIKLLSSVLSALTADPRQITKTLSV